MTNFDSLWISTQNGQLKMLSMGLVNSQLKRIFFFNLMKNKIIHTVLYCIDFITKTTINCMHVIDVVHLAFRPQTEKVWQLHL